MVLNGIVFHSHSAYLFNVRPRIWQATALMHAEVGSTRTTISWIEFCRVIEKGLHKGEAATAAQMFELLDTKGTGQLGPDALRAALQRWGCDASDHAVDKMVRYSTRRPREATAHRLAQLPCFLDARLLTL